MKYPSLYYFIGGTHDNLNGLSGLFQPARTRKRSTNEIPHHRVSIVWINLNRLFRCDVVPIYHAVSRAAKDVRHVTGTAAEYHIRQQPNNMIHMHGLHAIYTRKIRAVVLVLNVQWHAFYSNFYYITIYLDHYITLINITTTVSQVLVPSSIWKI